MLDKSIWQQQIKWQFEKKNVYTYTVENVIHLSRVDRSSSQAGFTSISGQ